MSGIAPSPMTTPDIANLLRRRPDPSPPVASPEEELPDLAHEPQTTTTPRVVATAPMQTASPAASNGGKPQAQPALREYLRSIAVYLPRSVHQHLRAQAVARGTTATALMLEAVNSTHDRLTAPLAKVQIKDDGANLFDIPQARTVSEPTMQTTIRVTDSQHQALAALATTYDVNRSQLITAALRLYLA